MATNSIQQLYVAYFGRPADADGLVYWDKALAAAPGSLPAIAQAFTRSAEFQAKLDLKQGIGVVDVLYKNMFGRAPDDAGKLYWNGLLAQGASVESVALELGRAAQGADLVAFQAKASAASAFTAELNTRPEVDAYTKPGAQPQIADFISYVHDARTLEIATSPYSLAMIAATLAGGPARWTVPADHDAQLQTLYVAYLSRPADPGGYAYWGRLLDGSSVDPDLGRVADAFSSSAEFRDTYAQTTNAGKVNAIYQNLFGHDANGADMARLSAQLDAGQSTGQVIAAVLSAPQAQDKAILGFKVQVASAITTALDTPREQLAYQTYQADQLVTAYLAQVHDERTWRAAIQPEAIDALIFSFSGNTGPVPPPAADLVLPELPELQIVGLAAPMHDDVLL